MSVDIPTPIDTHVDDVTKAGTFGSPTNVGDKANGGLPLNTKGTQWYGKTVTGGAGLYWNFSSVQNFSSNEKIYLIAHQYNAPNRVSCGTVANEGLNVRMYTNQTNYRLFVLGGQDTDFGKFRRSPTPVIVDPTTAGDRDEGTYNPASVASYGFGVYYSQFAGGSTNWNYVTRSVLMGTKQDDSDIPRLYGVGVKLKDLHAAVFGITGWASTEHVYTEAAGDTYTYLCPFVIGYDSQGTTQTTFDDEGITVISPAHKVSSDPRFHLSNTSMRVHLDLRNNSADTATFSGTYIWGTEAPWNFNQSDNAVVTLSGATFKNMGDFTVGSSVSGSATWNGAGVVIKNTSADLDGSSFKNPNNNYLLRLSGGQTISDMTFTSYSGDIAIDMTASGTYTFDNIQFDGSGTYEVEIDSGVTGDITINLTNGSTALTAGDINNLGSGSVTINNNVTIRVTVKDAITKSLITNARVFLETDPGGTEIFNEITGADGKVEDTTYNYTGDEDVVGVVRQGTSTPYYRTGSISGTITSNGFEITILLIKDE